MTYFVSNMTCPNSSWCSGSKSAPFDSLMKALLQIHTIDLADKYQSQNIDIYLLGTTHYILNSQFPKNQTMRFFRRMNATIKLAAWLCEQEMLSGCFSQVNGERAQVIIKTFIFSFEIHKIFNVSNIDFYGNDIVLKTNTGLSCYGSKSICCNEANFTLLSTANECGLKSRSISIVKTALTKVIGLFNIKLLYNDDMNTPADILITPNPSFYMTNVSINYFYSSNVSVGWLNFINFGNLGYTINLSNVLFKNNFFPYGILYFSNLEDDPAFYYLNSTMRASLYQKYPLSTLYNSSIVLNGFSVSGYYQYAVSMTGGLSVIFSILNKQNINNNYKMNNVNISNIQSAVAIYFFTFNSTLSTRPLISFTNLTMINDLNVMFVKMVNCDITISSMNYQSTNNTKTYNLFNLTTAGSLTFYNSQFMLSNFSNYFLLSGGCNSSFYNSTFYNLTDIAFSIDTSSLTFSDSQIISSNSSIVPFTVKNSILIFNNHRFSSYICTASYLISSTNSSILFYNAKIYGLIFNNSIGYLLKLTGGAMQMYSSYISNYSTTSNYIISGTLANFSFQNSTFTQSLNTMNCYIINGTLDFTNCIFTDIVLNSYLLYVQNFTVVLQNNTFTRVNNFTINLFSTNIAFFDNKFSFCSNSISKYFMRNSKIFNGVILFERNVFDNVVGYIFSITGVTTVMRNVTISNSFLNYYTFMLDHLNLTFDRLNIENTTLTKTFFMLNTGSLSILNCLADSITNLGSTFLQVQDSNLTFLSSAFSGYYTNATNGNFLLLTNSIVVIHQIYNVTFLNFFFTQNFYILSGSSSLLLPAVQFMISNVIIKNITTFNRTVNAQLIFLSFSQIHFDSIYISSCRFSDLSSFTLISVMYEFNKLIIQEIYVGFVKDLSYNEINLTPYVQQGEFQIFNVLFENLSWSTNCFGYLMQISNLASTVIRNTSFTNIFQSGATSRSFFLLTNVDNILLSSNFIQALRDTTFTFVFSVESSSYSSIIATDNYITSIIDNNLKILNAHNVESVFFSGNRISNFSKTLDGTYLGGTCFFSSDYDSTTNFIYASQNYFTSNTGNNYGVFSTNQYFSVTFLDNYFENSSSSTYGGSFATLNSEYILINNIFSIGSQSSQGGITYIFNCPIQVFVTKLISLDSEAQNGGGVYLNQIFNSFFSEIFMINSNSFSSGSGGSFVMENSNNVSFVNVNIKFSYSDKFGGAFYLMSVECAFENINIESSLSSNSGGAFAIDGELSKVLIENATFLNCSAKLQGAVFTSSNIFNLTIKNASITNSQVDFNTGLGVLSFNGYGVQEDPTDNRLFYLENVSFKNNTGKGACLSYDSNNKIIIRNSSAVNIIGSIFIFTSDSLGIVEISDFVVTQTNIYSAIEKEGFPDLKSSLIIFQKINVHVFNFSASRNWNGNYFFEVENNLIFEIENFTVSDFYSYNSTSFPCVFSLLSSTVSITNLAIFYSNDIVKIGEKSGFFYGDSLSLFLENNSFFGAELDSNPFLYFSQSEITFEKCLFENLESLVGVINFATSNITIANSVFQLNRNGKSSVDDAVIDIYLETSSLTLQNVTFISNSSGNVLSIQNAINITLVSCSFMSYNDGISSDNKLRNANSLSLRALYLNGFSNFLTNNCSYSRFYSPKGGVLFAKNSDSLNAIMSFNSCLFQNNSAYFGGVAFFQGQIVISINESNFQNNKAIIKAGINNQNSGKAGCLVFEFADISQSFLNSTTFTNNYAEKFGPTFLIKSDSVISSQNLRFINNSDSLNFTSSIAGTPIRAHVLYSNFTIDFVTRNLSNVTDNKEKGNTIISLFETQAMIIASGQNFNFSIMMTDYYNQTLIFDNQTNGKITCSYYNKTSNITQMIVVENPTAYAENGFLNFRKVQLIWLPGSIASCIVNLIYQDSAIIASSTDVSSDFSDTLNLNLNLTLRKCLSGEIYREDYACYKCDNETFSVGDPMNKSLKCKACPENALCFGGDAIYPHQGSWRASSNSSLILKCPTPESCLGIDTPEIFGKIMNLSRLLGNISFSTSEMISGKCGTYYWGNLCYSCKNGYGRFNDSPNAFCTECKNMVWPYVKTGLGFLVILVFFIVQMKCFMNVKDNNPNFAIFLKLFIHHFQIITLVSLVGVLSNAKFDVFFQFYHYFSSLYLDFFPIDCLLQEIDPDLLTQKIVFMILLPIILCLFLAITWLLILLFYVLTRKKTKNFPLTSYPSTFIRILLVVLFILYPDILRKIFIVFNCINIDDSTNLYVLQYDPNIVCWSRQHMIWAFGIAGPGILIWGLFSPIIVFYILLKNRFAIKELSSKEEVKKLEAAQIFIKTIKIEVDPWYKDNIFAKQTFPISKTLKYMVGNTNFEENYEIVEKQEKNENLEQKGEMIVSQKVENILDLEFSPQKEESIQLDKGDKKFLVEVPQIFYEYCNFVENLEPNKLTAKNLTDHPVSVLISSEIKTPKEEEADDYHVKKRISAFGSKRLKPSFTLSEKNFFIFLNLKFLYIGFKNEYLYWEVIIFSKKFILIMVSILNEFFEESNRNLNLMFCLISYFYWHVKSQPFERNCFNIVESVSHFVALVTFLIGILIENEEISKASIFFLVLVFFVNVFYLVLWGYYVLKYTEIKQFLSKKIKEAKDKLKRFAVKISSFFSSRCKKK